MGCDVTMIIQHYHRHMKSSRLKVVGCDIMMMKQHYYRHMTIAKVEGWQAVTQNDNTRSPQTHNRCQGQRVVWVGAAYASMTPVIDAAALFCSRKAKKMEWNCFCGKLY